MDGILLIDVTGEGPPLTRTLGVIRHFGLNDCLLNSKSVPLPIVTDFKESPLTKRKGVNTTVLGENLYAESRETSKNENVTGAAIKDQ